MVLPLLTEQIKNSIFKVKVHLFRRSAIQIFNSLLAEGRLPRLEREMITFERILKLLHHAYENTAFYKNYYDSQNFDVYSVKNLGDIQRIPIVTKEHLSNQSNEFFSSNLPSKFLRKSVTGGSSGEPTTVYHDTRVQVEGFGWYLMTLWGANPASNAAFLERYNPSTQGKLQYLINQLLWWPTRRAHLDITKVTDEKLWAFYERCVKIKPLYIEGYVGAIQEFAQFMSKNQLQLPSVYFVWTTSAPLTNSTRKVISDAFHCPVYDQYGCCEVYWLGAEVCTEQKLHVFDTFRHIEVINKSGKLCNNDEYGSVIITDLLNYSFPLIRYQNGDRAARSKDCSCGVTNFGILRPVKGRITENILLPEGGFIPGEFLTTLFDNFPNAVSQFQVIQDTDYSVTVAYVAGADRKAKDELARAKEYISNVFENAKIALKIKPVESIRHDGGKLRYVISKVAASYKV